jgi:hypothetical protein
MSTPEAVVKMLLHRFGVPPFIVDEIKGATPELVACGRLLGQTDGVTTWPDETILDFLIHLASGDEITIQVTFPTMLEERFPVALRAKMAEVEA